MLGRFCRFYAFSRLWSFLVVSDSMYSWLSAQQASYSVVCACVVMLRLNTDNQWHDREDHFSQKGLTRWQEAILCILSMATLGFLVGLCYRTGAPVAYAIALLVMMGLLTIPLLARQVCTSYHSVGFTSSSCSSTIPLCETLCQSGNKCFNLFTTSNSFIFLLHLTTYFRP